jgi:pimeloyl-ACP methyl ester carboxylesterase
MAQLTISGRAVGYLEHGDGPAAPLLLLHGFTGSKEDFAPVLEALASDRRVVAVDLPGHGDSEGEDDPAAHSLSAQASWLLAVVDALGIGDLHLLGHSMGGLVVQRVALLASERLRSLVLMGTGLGAVREEAAEGWIVPIAVAARDHGMEAAWEQSRRIDAARGIEPRSGDPERDAFVQRRFLALNPAAVVGEARTLIAAAPAGAFLRGIDLPVLVLHGEDDEAWLPGEQRLLADTVRGAELAVIADAAHSPQLENTAAWLKVVLDFLDRAER